MLTIVAIYNKFEFLLSFHEAEQIAVMGKNRRKTHFSAHRTLLPWPDDRACLHFILSFIVNNA